MNNITFLAQANPNQPGDGISSQSVDTQGQTTTSTKTEQDANAPAGQQGQPQTPYGTFILFGVMAVLLYFMLFRGPKKRQQQHQKMVQNLNKNDRVQTIGGIIGTIVQIEGDEITLKIDESNNTKMKVSSSAISKNISNKNSNN
jgi:preprotein translocase subunit YajC